MQTEVHVRLYEELNGYLPAARRKRSFVQTVNEGTTVEELLRLLGVPRSEVDLVLINGESVPLTRVLGWDDRVSIYPVFESFDIRPIACIHKEPLRQIRFIADRGLGRLCASLRRLGFDVIEGRALSCAALIEAAEREKRILLTRGRSFSGMPLSRLYVVQENEAVRQLNEVIRRFDLERESLERSDLGIRSSFER